MKLEEIKKLIDAATPGPWLAHYETGLNPMVITLIEASGGQNFGERICGSDKFTNMEFIAASRTLMPKLLAVAEAAAEIAIPDMGCGPEDECPKCSPFFKLSKAFAALEAE